MLGWSNAIPLAAVLEIEAYYVLLHQKITLTVTIKLDRL